MDQKIVAALERISQVVRTLAWKTGQLLGLNPIQAQILKFLLHHGQQNNQISSLAKEFTITKASMSDTISSLERKNLVRKMYAAGAVRNFRVELTSEGEQTAEKVTLYAQNLFLSVRKLPIPDKHQLFSVLGNIIFDLHTSGVITVQRMCYTCKYYETQREQHYCKLLQKSLLTEQLQIDCSDHQYKAAV